MFLIFFSGPIKTGLDFIPKWAHLNFYIYGEGVSSSSSHKSSKSAIISIRYLFIFFSIENHRKQIPLKKSEWTSFSLAAKSINSPDDPPA